MLLEKVTNVIRIELGNDVSDFFLKNENIANLDTHNDTIQRLALNSYFRLLLLSYRTMKDIDISPALAYLTIHGDNNEWYNLFAEYVIAFLSEHDVYQILMENNNANNR